jgi:hypothetical protein
MRTGYSVGKVITFCGLALAHALSELSTGAAQAAAAMMQVLPSVAWLTVAVCLLRGLPVITSSLRRYWGPGHLAAATSE